MSGAVPDLPEITSENFEEQLSSDSALVDFLNNFLLLPSFLESVRYNKERGVFEVGVDPAETLSSEITALKEKSNDPAWFPTKPLVDNSYTVSCLDQAQAMQWIRRQRLPFFLQSDCYFEYRLASCLCQMGSTKERLFRQEPFFSSSAAVLQHESTTSHNPGHPGRSNHSCPHTQCPSISSGPLKATKDHDIEKPEASQAGQHLTQLYREPSPSPCKTVASTPATVQTNIAEIHKETGGQSDRTVSWDQCPHLPSGVCKCVATRHSEVSPVLDKNGQTKLDPTACPPFTTVRNDTPSLECRCAFVSSLPEDLSISCPAHDHQRPENSSQTSASPKHNIGAHDSRRLFLDFKRFLRGRSGERVLNLWMDIERLKTLYNLEAKNRHLVWMKNQYLLGSSSTALGVEFLTRLELISSTYWTEDRLRFVQQCLTEVLLLYWGRRFIMSHPHIKRGATTFLWSCWDCQLSLTGLYCCPRHLSPQPQHSACLSQTSLTPSVVGIHCSEMERMEQALCLESRAGFFFTHFCQTSGNQLWANAAQFYRELQEYHQLFYQSTLDPYRVQHKAQVLYATYVCSAAQKSVSLHEQSRRHIFTRLTPPFEELFDQAEEHTLSLLLEPWTILTQQDTSKFHRVAVWEDERVVEPELYKTLQSLYTQTLHRQQQCAQEHKLPPSPAKSAKDPDPWAQVPQQFRRHRLGTLLRNRLELQHFLSFLEENFASMDLLCWLDIEQLKRTPNDAAGWEEKSKNIGSQYLSRKYLFGPSSPANKQQQTELLRLAGGWAKLQREPLTMPVLSEVQSLVRNRIERKWLPLFFSSEEFITRQKLQAEFGDVVEDQLFLCQKKKRQVWKQVDGGMMSMSQEVLALRRALLNPVTCQHFRLFLSLRGELLENDLLFWLEVQRYKDLCHSHCDEATVQQKVSTIINCFIDSSIPPSVQIHLPPEQAQLILERRSTLGPYIFREAQMCVFTELLKHWSAFVEFRSSMSEQQVVPELEKRRSRERERRRRDERDQQNDMTPEALQGERGSVIEGLIEETRMYEGEEEAEETEEHQRVDSAGQQVSWSYSKYLAALEREEMLIHTQELQEKRADLSSVHSGRSVAHTNSRCSSGKKNSHPPEHTHTTECLCTSSRSLSAGQFEEGPNT